MAQINQFRNCSYCKKKHLTMAIKWNAFSLHDCQLKHNYYLMSVGDFGAFLSFLVETPYKTPLQVCDYWFIAVALAWLTKNWVELEKNIVINSSSFEWAHHSISFYSYCICTVMNSLFFVCFWMPEKKYSLQLFECFFYMKTEFDALYS